MRSRWKLIVAIVVALVLTAWIVWRVAFRDTATPVSAAQVVDEVIEPVNTVAPTALVETAPERPGPPGSEPDADFVVGSAPGDPGLYVYATTGSEEIDALTGARHDYPAETFVTLQPGGCGLIERWTALEERWSQRELCPTEAGYRLEGFESFHKWFGQSDLQDFDCDPATALVIPSGEAGPAEYECTTEARIETFQIEVVGIETVTVAGTEVEAVHVRVTSVLSRGSEGTSRTDTWYLRGTGLILRRIATRASVNDSAIGDVSYMEDYEIDLVSLIPAGRPD